MYDLASFGRMLADRARTGAYAEALRRAVRPGAVVLDIGTGPGLFALLACRFGARRVYALEPGEAVQTARELARANGVADRVECIQALSTAVELPERADVVVSDIRGVLPLCGRIVSSLADARARHLAPGGVMIPRADTVRAAPVEAPEPYARLLAPWEEDCFGFDAAAARRAVANTWTRARVEPEQLLAAPEVWAVLDWTTLATPDVRGTLEWTVARPGTAHGLSAWFDADLAEGVGYTTGPDAPETVYGTAFFPWERPVSLDAGDRVAVELEARLVGDEYLWSWSTRVERAGGSVPVAAFRQSTFFAEPLSPARLKRRAHHFTPRLGEEGRIDALALSRMDGSASLGEIARELHARFPARFPTWEAALTRVGRLSEELAEREDQARPEHPPGG